MFLLRSYVSDNDLCSDNESICEFVDEGFSGTDRKRPAFMKMLACVELKQAHIVIVKDFSSFKTGKIYSHIGQLRQ